MSEKNYPITAFPAFIDVTEDAQVLIAKLDLF